MGHNKKIQGLRFPCTLFCMGGGGGGRIRKINGMALTKFDPCIAADQLLQQSLERVSRNSATTSTLVGPNIFHLQSRSYTFKIMVGPIIVWLRLSQMVTPTLHFFRHPCVRFMVHSATKITSLRCNSTLFHG